jgi:hypothetical protein
MATTQSGDYTTCRIAGRWYFFPTDPEWLAFNAAHNFSRPYDTEAEALAAAELWQASEGQATV